MAARFRIAWSISKEMVRVSGDFLPKLVFREGKKISFDILCVSFECDSLSEELGEEKEVESSGRGFYFSRASQVMGLGLIRTSVK